MTMPHICIFSTYLQPARARRRIFFLSLSTKKKVASSPEHHSTVESVGNVFWPDEIAFFKSRAHFWVVWDDRPGVESVTRARRMRQKLKPSRSSGSSWSTHEMSVESRGSSCRMNGMMMDRRVDEKKRMCASKFDFNLISPSRQLSKKVEEGLFHFYRASIIRWLDSSDNLHTAKTKLQRVVWNFSVLFTREKKLPKFAKMFTFNSEERHHPLGSVYAAPVRGWMLKATWNLHDAVKELS